MNLMNTMMLSCVKATELMEMKEHVSLGFMRNIQLQMHTAMCSGCRNYMRQSKLINELLRKKFGAPPIIDNTDTLEVAIISKINKN